MLPLKRKSNALHIWNSNFMPLGNGRNIQSIYTHTSFSKVDIVKLFASTFHLFLKFFLRVLGLDNLLVSILNFYIMMLTCIFSVVMTPIATNFHLHSFTPPNTSCTTLLIPILSRLRKSSKKCRSTPEDSYPSYA